MCVCTSAHAVFPSPDTEERYSEIKVLRELAISVEFVIFILNSIKNENLQNMRIHYAMHSTLLKRGERTAVRVVISNRHIQNLVVCTWEVCRWISCFRICTYTVRPGVV